MLILYKGTWLCRRWATFHRQCFNTQKTDFLIPCLKITIIMCVHVCVSDRNKSKSLLSYGDKFDDFF